MKTAYEVSSESLQTRMSWPCPDGHSISPVGQFWPDIASLDWWCRAGRGNAVKTRRVEQAVVSWPLPKNYSSRSYESSLDGAASECSNK
ncbi:hypothetical protein TNCV_145101 [Trichonephila clavipes]|nr:hypothetical protein TNCV_145101 [Trichonephila clavipes]